MTNQATRYIRYTRMPSPIGELIVATCPQGVCRIGWEEDKYFHDVPEGWTESDQLHFNVLEQLQEYFDGQRRTFELPVIQAGTDFQQAVWLALTKIPFGETRTYGEQAQLMSKPKAVRAVGAANGRNQVPIIIPCHRVIGANGSLTGFAGGIEVKRWLLKHEGAIPQSLL